jgi:hypothetical protein
MGEIRTLGIAGDVKQLWDPNNPDEVAAARRVFDDLRRKSYLAFRVTDTKGKRGEQMTVFDPAAGKIIMAPPMAGG